MTELLMPYTTADVERLAEQVAETKREYDDARVEQKRSTAAAKAAKEAHELAIAQWLTEREGQEA